MKENRFTVSVCLSLAAHYQALAFKYTSARSIKRNARLADHWYRCAEIERRWLKFPRSNPGIPLCAQENYLEAAIKLLEMRK
jgi:hypothetical protein